MSKFPLLTGVFVLLFAAVGAAAKNASIAPEDLSPLLSMIVTALPRSAPASESTKPETLPASDVEEGESAPAPAPESPKSGASEGNSTAEAAVLVSSPPEVTTSSPTKLSPSEVSIAGEGEETSSGKESTDASS